MPRALFINPWIYDFAAYDFWTCPTGLLSLAAVLRGGGWDVDYVDCLDRYHPALPSSRERALNTGKYLAEEVEKPSVLARIPRRYKRYGLPLDLVRGELGGLGRPDVIFVTSRMTYWYPGVELAVSMCRQLFDRTPILLGGTYATLLPEHAMRVCRPDAVIAGEGEWQLGTVLDSVASGLGGVMVDDQKGLDGLPFPAFDLMHSRKALTLETSRGCPFSCSYCATRRLIPSYRRKSTARATDEVEWAVRELGGQDIAFADDALMLSPDTHFLPLARELVRRRVRSRFHAPNSLFANAITEEVASAMRDMGFETVRLSLESADEKALKRWNRKVTPAQFQTAMQHLRKAGFSPEQIGVYLMCAMPGQTIAEVRASIDCVVEQGGTPRLCEYSPIPGTAEWERATVSSGLPLAEEPLLQNNSIYHMISGAIPLDGLNKLKHYAMNRMGKKAALSEFDGKKVNP